MDEGRASAMTRMGLLETMARADLEALTAALGRDYRRGSAERVAAADPAWPAAVERAEREVGALYAALCEADGTLLRWRQAVAELYRVWARVNDGPADEAADEARPLLEEVA
jgi:hypothetical protein